MRIAIVVGHNAVAQGARRVTSGLTEYTWNGRLAEVIEARAAPGEVRVFRRAANPGGYRAELGAVYAAVDEWGADVSAELHFNAGGVGATGTETWYASAAGAAVARRLQAAMVAVLGLRDRGIRRAGAEAGPGIDGTRGYLSLVSGRAPSVLIETHFGSSAGDIAAVDTAGLSLADAILQGLRGPAIAVPEPATGGAFAAWAAELDAAQAQLAAVIARRPQI